MPGRFLTIPRKVSRSSATSPEPRRVEPKRINNTPGGRSRSEPEALGANTQLLPEFRSRGHSPMTKRMKRVEIVDETAKWYRKLSPSRLPRYNVQDKSWESPQDDASSSSDPHVEEVTVFFAGTSRQNDFCGSPNELPVLHLQRRASVDSCSDESVTVSQGHPSPHSSDSASIEETFSSPHTTPIGMYPPTEYLEQEYINHYQTFSQQEEVFIADQFSDATPNQSFGTPEFWSYPHNNFSNFSSHST
jgi:hypothetical protein